MSIETVATAGTDGGVKHKPLADGAIAENLYVPWFLPVHQRLFLHPPMRHHVHHEASGRLIVVAIAERTLHFSLTSNPN